MFKACKLGPVTLLCAFYLLTCSTQVTASDAVRRKRSDDVDLAALQTLVQQQASSIQQLQSQMTALKAAQPATFAPVAFSVRFNADAENGLPLSAQAVLHFDQIITNVGNGFSTVTGMFTAPFAGVYSFYISFMSVNGAGHTRVAIVRQGAYVDLAFAAGHEDYDRGSTQVVIHLAKGEQVWARLETGPAVRGGEYTVFTGFLVQAE